ncbi:hypothetical protein F4780DRAFT_706252 [Xylariomycetidae sp. FL0641]|nr:hypothetical protein F4780DRAFT_706252 [Xylariomycetidae sp. FL0641]
MGRIGCRRVPGRRDSRTTSYTGELWTGRRGRWCLKQGKQADKQSRASSRGRGDMGWPTCMRSIQQWLFWAWSASGLSCLSLLHPPLEVLGGLLTDTHPFRALAAAARCDLVTVRGWRRTAAAGRQGTRSQVPGPRAAWSGAGNGWQWLRYLNGNTNATGARSEDVGRQSGKGPDTKVPGAVAVSVSRTPKAVKDVTEGGSTVDGLLRRTQPSQPARLPDSGSRDVE